jgi:CHAT domain-containing protein
MNATDDRAFGGEDGILTALEVSTLNLMGTELAVLSACETAIGEIVSGEGVFGLRRAFQHAGARTVFMSLWKIPDRATSDLTAGFYERWLTGRPKLDALRDSAVDVLNACRKSQGHGHPLVWGGIVLVGSPD